MSPVVVLSINSSQISSTENILIYTKLFTWIKKEINPSCVFLAECPWRRFCFVPLYLLLPLNYLWFQRSMWCKLNRSSKIMANSSRLNIFIFYFLHLDSGKNKKPFNMEKKMKNPQEEQQRRDPSPRTDRHAIDLYTRLWFVILGCINKTDLTGEAESPEGWRSRSSTARGEREVPGQRRVKRAANDCWFRNCPWLLCVC